MNADATKLLWCCRALAACHDDRRMRIIMGHACGAGQRRMVALHTQNACAVCMQFLLCCLCVRVHCSRQGCWRSAGDDSDMPAAAANRACSCRFPVN